MSSRVSDAPFPVPRPPAGLGVVLAAALAALAVGPRPWAAASEGRVSRPEAVLTAGIRETVLPNGLTVLTREVRSAPVVSFGVWYRVGSRHEHTGITGASHLLEHMLFKGTRRFRPGEIARTLFLHGAAFNASTYYDWTNYRATVAADRLELVMRIEADRMVNARIDPGELAAEMTVVRSELEGGENDPGRLLWRAVTAVAFEAHPYRWPVIGYRSDVEHMPREALYRHYRTHYGPNNAVVVIVGDFDTERALALVRKYFGRLRPIPPPPAVHTVEPPQRGERRVVVRRAGSLPMVLVAYKVPAATHPDFYTLDVLATLLGEGRTSRLYQGLVEKQLASRVHAGAPSLRDPFLFYLGATARPGVSAEQLEAALAEEVERVRHVPVSPEELERARNRIEADFVLQADSVSSQARQIGYWAMVADWRYLTTYLDRIRAVTAEDVQRVARQYLVADGRTVGHFVPVEGAPGPPPPPAREASARAERPRRSDRPVPLPPPSKVTPPRRALARFQLDNGLTVVIQENPAVPTFALRLSVPAGHVHQPEQPGLATLTAAMLSRGTGRRSALEFATALESVGASLHAEAEGLVTVVTGGGLARDFERVLDLLAEMLRDPAFPAEDLERVRGQLLARLRQARTNPDALARRAFERSVYPDSHPLRPPTLDEAERSLQDLTREDVVAFYQRQYGPDRAILVVAGALATEKVRAAVEARLGSWPRNPRTREPSLPEVPVRGAPERLVLPVPDRSQTTILWGHAGGLRRSDPDFYATQIMNLILGGGGALNSRLGNAIRDEEGLAYHVYSYFDASLYPGPFVIGLGTNPANARRALGLLEAEVRRIRERGVTAREVAEAVAYLTGRFPLRLETNGGMAEILWAMEFFRLGSDYLDRYAEYYRAVTVAQVNQAARTHLHPDRATLVLAGALPEGVTP